MKFYHEVRGCSLAVDIVARELAIGLDIEWVDMTSKRLADGSDYFAVNSKGTVPTLRLPDGQYLSEGAVIMQYLAERRPERGLFAAPGTMERYRILEWMSFVAADLHKGGFMPLFKKTTPDDYRPIARAYVATKLAWLDERLADRDFLVGGRFTIADAHCYTIASWASVHDFDLQPLPHLRSYLDRIRARPCVVAAERAAQDEGDRQRARRAAHDARPQQPADPGR